MLHILVAVLCAINTLALHPDTWASSKKNTQGIQYHRELQSTPYVPPSIHIKRNIAMSSNTLKNDSPILPMSKMKHFLLKDSNDNTVQPVNKYEIFSHR